MIIDFLRRFHSLNLKIRFLLKSEPALILAGLCQNSEWKKVESHLQTLHDLLTKWIRTGDENPPSEYQSQDYK